MTHARGSILLADDEEKILKRLGRALRDEGHEVVEATTMRDAQRYLGERTFDLLVVDNVMPGMTGLELIRELAQAPPVERPQIVMMTAHGSTQLVREAFKLGVEDFLEKPFEVDELLALARRAVKSQRLRTERQYLISERDAEFNHYGIVGRSRSMEKVLERAELVSQTKSTVLITGETGTGKEVIAGPYSTSSAGVQPQAVRGASTAERPRETLEAGAARAGMRRVSTPAGGRSTTTADFGEAHGGSIFLDEICSMTPKLQVETLLRVLQERRFERHSEKSRTIGAWMSASHRSNQPVAQKTR